ncbi:hypothetical protein ACO0M4_30120 [Streptomyces sp. RGM 3693]|uniref:hypothetical protein n=1 Tax=Streptomyces sp. RGM 3693 TaxID=3413284 RepID=UPI003D26F3BF
MGTDAGLPGHLLRIPLCDDECRPSVGAEPCRVVDIDRVQQRDVPVVGGTPLWTASQALRAPGERWGRARGGKTRCTAGAPAPTAAAQEQVARIAEAGMKADAFEEVV